MSFVSGQSLKAHDHQEQVAIREKGWDMGPTTDSESKSSRVSSVWVWRSFSGHKKGGKMSNSFV